MHRKNSFITLTYDNEHLPEGGTLNHQHFQEFMKRLRKRKEVKKMTSNLRFFMCGEYGEKTRRPHYHACLFGFDFPDKWLYSSKRGVKLYRSDLLEKMWPQGISTVGDVTFQSAAYVARYIMKKINGEMAEDHYKNVDIETGEIYSIEPEYTQASMRPGLGKHWFDKYWKDLYAVDQVVMFNGKKYPVPRYYDKLLEKVDPEKLNEIKQSRIEKASSSRTACLLEERKRQEAGAKIKERQVSMLVRTIDEAHETTSSKLRPLNEVIKCS